MRRALIIVGLIVALPISAGDLGSIVKEYAKHAGSSSLQEGEHTRYTARINTPPDVFPATISLVESPNGTRTLDIVIADFAADRTTLRLFVSDPTTGQLNRCVVATSATYNTAYALLHSTPGHAPSAYERNTFARYLGYVTDATVPRRQLLWLE